MIRPMLASAVVVLLATGLAGCGTGTHVSSVSAPTSAAGTPTTSSVISNAPVPPPPTTPAGPKTFPNGYKATITDASGDLAEITVKFVKASTQRPNEYGEAPKNGYYVTFTVSTKAVQKFDINPFDFYVKTADDRHWDQTAGNGIMATGDNALNATTLATGEKITGTVTFDVPAAHGTLMYAPANEALGGWTF